MTHFLLLFSYFPCSAGIDVRTGEAVDMLQLGIVESVQVKERMIAFAVEAVVALLRIDHTYFS